MSHRWRALHQAAGVSWDGCGWKDRMGMDPGPAPGAAPPPWRTALTDDKVAARIAPDPCRGCATRFRALTVYKFKRKKRTKSVTGQNQQTRRRPICRSAACRWEWRFSAGSHGRQLLAAPSSTSRDSRQQGRNHISRQPHSRRSRECGSGD